MYKYGVIPFRFGPAISEVVSEKEKIFYNNVASFAHASVQDICQNVDTFTVSVSLEEVQQTEHISYGKIINYASDWISEVDILVIDISDPSEIILPGRTEIHIASAIAALQAKVKSSGRNVLSIILMPELPPLSEPFRNGIQTALETKELVVISDDGEVLGQDVLNNFDSVQYQLQRSQTKEDPLELLKLKMIRRLGHFKRKVGDTNTYQCVRYFFDGSQCDKELVLLLDKYFNKKYNGGDKPVLFYHCTISDWLMESVVVFSSKKQLASIDLNKFMKRPSDIKGQLSCSPLIIVPLIDTGYTLENIIQKWTNEYDFPDPNILSILTTQSTNDIDRIRQLTVCDKKYDVDYFLKVKRTKTEIKDDCPLCLLEIPFSDYKREDYAMLTTYDMWDMVDDAGWKPEDDVPAHRTGLEKVPKFPEMVHGHGAWVSRKTLYRLSYEIRKFPAQPFLIICPDERGVGTLTDYLAVIHNNVTVVKVPPPVIDLCKDDDVSREFLESSEFVSENSWHKQLLTASPSQPVVAMEEFCVSGETRDALIRLVDLLNRTISCHFSIVNFCLTDASNNVPCYSLYEFHLDPEYLLEQKLAS